MQTPSLETDAPPSIGPAGTDDHPSEGAVFNGRLERRRGLKEAGNQLPALRARWPEAFSTDPKMVRPLASSALRTVIKEFGWSFPYARAVLSVWKSRSAYCHAVLRHAERVHLDGSASTETVDDKAQELARAKLAQFAARPRDKERRAPSATATALPGQG